MMTEIPLYRQSIFKDYCPVKHRVTKSFTIDPDVWKIAEEMRSSFGYISMSSLLEDLIMSAAETKQIVLIPGSGGGPPKRLFVLPQPAEKPARKAK